MKNSKANIFNKLNSDECTIKFKDAGINTAIVFGSVLTKDFTEDSDIDIAILSEHNISLSTIFSLEEFLQKLLNRDIDIVNLRDKNIDLSMKVTIYDHGTIIYNSDDLKLYNKDYEETERIYKNNESFRFFRERDVIFYE